MSQTDFVPLLLTHQSRLYGYVLSLVGDRNQADDLLQQTNSVLLRKVEDFEAGTNFVAWAFRIAYFEVMQYRRARHRERLFFDDELIGALAAVAEKEDERFIERQKFLRECLETMNERHRDVLRRRYLMSADLNELAAALGSTVNALKQLLFRAREGLRACISSKMEAAP